MTCAGQGLSLLWKHLTFDELLYPESHTDGLRERADFSESGVKTCCLTNIGSALQIQQVRVRASRRPASVERVSLGVICSIWRWVNNKTSLADHGSIDLCNMYENSERYDVTNHWIRPPDKHKFDTYNI